ncbi:MAG: hypothetical protein WDN49_27120 [Acetobacteraceae bacterium]
MSTRSASLRYLEKLRLLHAAVTAALTAGMLAWSILLWEQGRVTPGDIVLVTSLGFTILHGTRDLAVALVDTIQHVARLSEALATLLLPHELRDADQAKPLQQPKGRIEFRGRHLFLPGEQPGRAGPFQRGDRGGDPRRPGRPVGVGQVHRHQPAAAAAGRAVRDDPGGRP